MELTWLNQLEFLFRLILSVACGAVVGYERENQLKTAGTRTHSIVAVSSALMMLVSKYGFFDVLEVSGISLDPSRVAAGIVSAIGFLGAGIIFVRKQNVSGLTTSAGLWATVGIGMAIGAGMYGIGIASAGIVILVHLIFNRNSRFIRSTVAQQITLTADLRENIEGMIAGLFNKEHIEVISLKIKRIPEDDDHVEIRLSVRYPDTYRVEDIFSLLRQEKEIRSIEI